ncbi:hypothetical protein L798_02673 [Zootermopsis nevadensis]|uniref:Uncharacterized protein n=1 Tax=Zootermopsis nevadensis TaxID=136037 RepID=A0A067QRN9_ZOONE|nr:hypothetical protein L798_02673 [Zootermopsis nevadensis]
MVVNGSSVSVSSEDGNRPSVSLEGREFLGQLIDHQLLADSAPPPENARVPETYIMRSYRRSSGCILNLCTRLNVDNSIEHLTYSIGVHLSALGIYRNLDVAQVEGH